MKFLSAIFHPLLMATYCSLFFYWVFPQLYSPIPYESIPYFIGAVFVTTGVIPALSILFLILTRRISNLEITNLQERSLPFLSICLFYGVTTYMFYTKMQVPYSFTVIMVMVTVLILLIFLISFRFKISVHSAGIWGVAGILAAFTIKYLTADFIYPLMMVFLAAGLTTMSRLYLNRHTPSESWSGILLGFIFCFVSFYLFG